IAQDSMNEMRQILFDLKPVRQNNDSLLSVLEDYFAEIKAKYNFCIELNSRGVPQIYPPYIQTALFRLIQESVNNCRKHAGVNKAHIMLSENREQVEILIEDAGKGFDKTGELNKADSFGIAGMLERTALLGGTIEIESKPGAGTQILIIIPLKGEVL
ncbi:MAG: ATP-binding protein, partial [Syntrophomonadaceae bacterium]|nr:ATP-binding protein [Syntrophomonadaceae bacterium]